jgi:hypothetical protein
MNKDAEKKTNPTAQDRQNKLLFSIGIVMFLGIVGSSIAFLLILVV